MKKHYKLLLENCTSAHAAEFKNQRFLGQFPAQIVAEKVEEDTNLEKSLEVQDSDVADDDNKQKRISWAKLLSRVFALDMGSCELCSGDTRAISAVIKTEVIVKILTHLGIQATAPPISPSRVPRQEEFWDQSTGYDDYSQLN